MATMKEMVHERVARLEDYHQGLKRRRFGWLVRPVILVVGTVVLVVGIITIPLPGQGWLTTFLGVGILSLEVAWARAFLHHGVRYYDLFFAWYRRQSQAVRWLLATATVAVIFAMFALVTWITWGFGGADWLDPVMEDYLGLRRF